MDGAAHLVDKKSGESDKVEREGSDPVQLVSLPREVSQQTPTVGTEYQKELSN